MILTIDFETRSAVDIKKCGAFVYAEDPSTDVLCLAVKVDDNEPEVFIPPKFERLYAKPTLTPGHICKLIESAEIIEAHNMQFEVAIWTNVMHKRYGFPDLPKHKLRCSAAIAASFAIPRGLDQACKVISEEQQKDMDGKRIMMKMCKPRRVTKKDIEAEKKHNKYYTEVKRLGGIRPDSLDKEAKRKLKENGVRGLTSKKGYGIDQMAEWMINGGTLFVPANVNPGDHLLNQVLDIKPETDTDELDELESAYGDYLEQEETGSVTTEYLWHEKPEEFHRLVDYCKQDVNAEYSLSQSLHPLSQDEQKLWALDLQINERGVYVDTKGIQSLIDKVQLTERALLAEITHLTNGDIKSVRQVAKTLLWLGTKGVNLDNLQKGTVMEALPTVTDPDAKRLLEIRQLLGKSSVSKLSRMLQMACRDSRVRGVFLFHGANTGRWSGRGMQPHNYPRDSYDPIDIDRIVSIGIDMIEMLYDSVLLVASKSLRGMISADENKKLFCADYASIEARVLAWLAGQAQDLKAFYDGLDAYKVAAVDIYGVNYENVSKEMRSVGKVAVLALGYQGWVNAFREFCKVYGVSYPEENQAKYKAKLKEWAYNRASTAGKKKLTPDEKKKIDRVLNEGPSEEDYFEEWATPIIRNWREARPQVVALWKGLEHAAISAIKNPGKAYSYGRIKYAMRGRFLHCRLPSGRLLSYCDPYVKEEEDKYGRIKEGIRFYGVDSTTSQWTKQHTYGGKLCENVVQAIARDLLAYGMQQVEANGFPIVMHVHDEAVAELPEDTTKTLEEFEKILAKTPEWAKGCPVKAEGWTGKRYRK